MRNLFSALLFLFFCSTTFSQEKENNRVTLDKIASAQTFVIQADFYNGDVVDFGRGKTDVVKIFPQLKEMKMVKKDGDVLVRITAYDPVPLQEMRISEEYAAEIKKYELLHPLPVSQPANTIGYFQPLTLSIEKNGEILFSMRTIGDYYQLNLGANKSSDEIPTGFNVSSYFLKSHRPERSVELRNLQRNLKFLEVHLDVLR